MTCKFEYFDVPPRNNGTIWSVTNAPAIGTPHKAQRPRWTTLYWCSRHFLNAAVFFFLSNASRLVRSVEGDTALIDFFVTFVSFPPCRTYMVVCALSIIVPFDLTASLMLCSIINYVQN